MAVKIRLKKLGRKHRPFFRVCAMDVRAPRNGRVIEELGTYDPMVPDTNARAILDGERIEYWMGVGAQPTQKVSVLIRKYGKEGSHLNEQQAALNLMAARRSDAIAAATVKAARDAEAAQAANKKAMEEKAMEEAAAAKAAAEAPAEEAVEETKTEEGSAEGVEESTAETSGDAEPENKEG